MQVSVVNRKMEDCDHVSLQTEDGDQEGLEIRQQWLDQYKAEVSRVTVDPAASHILPRDVTLAPPSIVQSCDVTAQDPYLWLAPTEVT